MTLAERVTAFLDQHGASTCSQVAVGVRARWADVQTILLSGPFHEASAPAFANPRATYWEPAAVPSQALPQRRTGRVSHKQKVLNLLRDGKPHTHHEIYALGCVGHSRIADLRRDGHNIECVTETHAGERVSVYRLVGSLDEAPGQTFGTSGASSSESHSPGSLDPCPSPNPARNPMQPDAAVGDGDGQLQLVPPAPRRGAYGEAA